MRYTIYRRNWELGANKSIIHICYNKDEAISVTNMLREYHKEMNIEYWYEIEPDLP